MANGNKKSGKSHKPCDLYLPHTSSQTPRCVREKRFPLLSCLSQRKTTHINESTTNNDVSVKKKMTYQRNKVKVHHILIMKMAFLFV